MKGLVSFNQKCTAKPNLRQKQALVCRVYTVYVDAQALRLNDVLNPSLVYKYRPVINTNNYPNIPKLDIKSITCARPFPFTAFSASVYFCLAFLNHKHRHLLDKAKL